MAALTAEEFQAAADVSRETLRRLVVHLELLKRWQPRINLVANSTLNDPWRRHYLDCAQLVHFIPAGTSRLTDLGTGAGFPGLALSIMSGIETHLIESDERKCVFLREAARQTGAPVTIHVGRVESVVPWPTDVILARALAPLSDLFRLSWPFLSLSDLPFRRGLFLKSENFETELTTASENWNMRIESHSSISDPRGRILVIRDLTPEVNAHGRRHNVEPSPGKSGRD